MHPLSDIARVVVIVLYAVIFGQTAAIVYFYQQVRNRLRHRHNHGGLLPLHVVLVGLGVLAFGFEAVAVNVQRIAQPATFWLAYNLLLFGTVAFALQLVLRYERRRFQKLPPQD